MSTVNNTSAVEDLGRSENASETNPVVPNVMDAKFSHILRILAIVSYVVAVGSNVRYNFGRRSPWDDDHQEDVAFTPFTANVFAILLFWVLLIISQFVYLTKYFFKSPTLINWQFVISNALLIGWSYLFSRSFYNVSELLAIVNFLQLLAGYLLAGSYRIHPLADWFAIHGSVIAIPLVWSHYLIFWNGAVMFGARRLTARLICNILIWVFLFVPGFLMLITGDYLLGFASAWISFSIGLCQLLIKVFALQWVFAFIIAAILLVITLILAFVPPMERYTPPALIDLRVKATNSEETAPLLIDS